MTDRVSVRLKSTGGVLGAEQQSAAAADRLAATDARWKIRS